MNDTIAIRSLAGLGEREITELGEVLIDCVEGGASVGFMQPMLVLNTATEEAARLYARLGWQQCGEIPDYALLPDGPPCATKLFYKRIEGKA